MESVTNREEILDNVEVFLEALEDINSTEFKTAIDLIKSSNTFLAILTEEINFFIPALFLANKDQTFTSLNKNLDENELADVVTKILGSTPKIDKTMDELFLDFCDEVEINRNHVGLSREYWIIKDL